jgi:hypothetical protein
MCHCLLGTRSTSSRPAPDGTCGWLEFATDRPALVAQYSGKIHVFPFSRP